MRAKVGIIGAGRWGTALAILLSQVNHQVTLFCLTSEVEQLINERESQNLPGFPIPEQVAITCSGDGDDLELVILALPGEALAAAWESWRQSISPKTIVVNVAKMIDCHEQGLILPSHIVDSERYKFVHFACAAFPQGLLRGSPTIGTAYSSDESSAKRVVGLFQQTLIRPYHSRDVNGGQIGSALKNTIAIASGIAAGLGFDETTRMAIASRGLKEIRDFASRHLGHPETFGPGTTIMTDLGATCFSPYSRNLKFGQALATKTVQEARLSIIGTVEGIHTTLTLAQVCSDFAETMPISYAIWQIISGQSTPMEAMKQIMARPIKYEG